MYGTYCTITDIKASLGITSTTDDTIMRKIAESASRNIDNFCQRFFYIESATKYFEGSNSPLWLSPDLLSIDTDGLSTDEDGDATFESTFETTDYHLKPFNTFPKTHIILSDDSDYGSFANGVRRGVEIAGVWGYGDGISATPYIVDTTLTEALDASETGVDVTAITNLNGGNTILIDSEQMYVYSYSTLTLTVERGVNGTTAATHDNSTSLYIYQYPADIRQACIDLSVAIYQNRSKRGLSSERIGDYSYTLSKDYVDSLLSDSIFSYRKLRV